MNVVQSVLSVSSSWFSVSGVLGDFKSTQTDDVTETIDLVRESGTVLQFERHDRFFRKAENRSRMIDELARRSREDAYIVMVNESQFPLN